MSKAKELQIEKQKLAKELLYKKVDSGEIELKEAVKLIRKIYHLNQSEYAKKVGVSVKTIANIECGLGNPTLESLSKILAPLKLKLRVVRE